MTRESQRLNVIRLAVGNALFIGGVAAIVAGSWLASEWWSLASCLMGGIMLFALAELIAPFPDPLKRYRDAPLVETSRIAREGAQPAIAARTACATSLPVTSLCSLMKSLASRLKKRPGWKA